LPPDPDDQEHGYEAEFEEGIEQHQIHGAEDADDQGLEDQEGDQVFKDPGLDGFPGGQDTDRHQEGGQQDEEHRNAVHGHGVVQTGKPRNVLDELEAGIGTVELRRQDNGQGQCRQCGQQGHPLGRLDRTGVVSLAEQAQAQDRRHARQGRVGDEGKNTEHQVALP